MAYFEESCGRPFDRHRLLVVAELVSVMRPPPQTGHFFRRRLAQAALELGEAREACQPDHVVPQLDRRILLGQPTDHRARTQHLQVARSG